MEALIDEETTATSTIGPRAKLDQAIQAEICNQLLEIDHHTFTHHDLRVRTDTLIVNLNNGRFGLTKEQGYPCSLSLFSPYKRDNLEGRRCQESSPFIPIQKISSILLMVNDYLLIRIRG